MKTPVCLLCLVLLASGGCAGRSWFGKSQAADDDFTVDSPSKLTAQPSATEAAAKAKAPDKNAAAKAAAAKAKSQQSGAEDDSIDGGTFFKRFSNARAQENAGKLDEARNEYQKLIVEYPKRYECYHRLGLVADRQKRFHEAESLFSQALRIKPMDAELLNDLGYCYYLQGQLDKAESAISKAVAAKPAESRYRNNLGLIFGAKGQMDAAMESFRHGGSEADAQYNMAFVVASRGDMEGAKKRFNLALAADPNHEASRKALRSFEQSDRDGEKPTDNEFTSDGRRWIPYIEDTATTAKSAPQGNNAAARSMQTKAHSLIQSRMAASGSPQ